MKRVLVGIGILSVLVGMIAVLCTPPQAQAGGQGSKALQIFLTNCNDIILANASVRVDLQRDGSSVYRTNEKTDTFGLLRITFPHSDCCDLAVLSILPIGAMVPDTVRFIHACGDCGDRANEWAEQLSPIEDCSNPGSTDCCNELWSQDDTFWHVRYHP